MLYLTSSVADTIAAANLLRAGELVALPTETVYGLAGDATNPAALEAIFRAKRRPADHPLIVHLAAAEQLPDWAAAVPEGAWRLASAFWPGPLTMVLPARPSVSALVTGGQPTVALRVPAHPVFQAVLRQLGRALAAPSANPFGRISPTTAEHVQRHLAGRIAAVVDGGACPVGIESTIVDFSGEHPRLLRPGLITAEALARHLPRIEPGCEAAPRVPGALASHYAPSKPCHWIPPDLQEDPFPGQRVGLIAIRPVEWPVARFWPLPARPEAFASELYSVLHQADASDCGILLISLPPEGPAWTAVHDRIGRAARGLPRERAAEGLPGA